LGSKSNWESKTPGVYLIKEGEKLSSLLKRTGGITSTAFLSGVIFTRNSLKQKEEEVFGNFIRKQKELILKKEISLEEEILTPEEKNIRKKSIQHRKEMLEQKIAYYRPEGRITIELEEIMNGKSDIVLEQGDRIHIPSIPNWVLVIGEVYHSCAVSFRKDKNAEYYCNFAGGLTSQADSENLYIIKADGRAISKKAEYREIQRGDIIVVPQK